jgi:hypothetical protein
MCGRSAGTYRDLGDLKQRDLSNLNLGDLKKGPNGGLSPTPQKNMVFGRLKTDETWALMHEDDDDDNDDNSFRGLIGPLKGGKGPISRFVPTEANKNTGKACIYIDATSVIRTHDSNIKESMCHRPRGQ